MWTSYECLVCQEILHPDQWSILGSREPNDKVLELVNTLHPEEICDDAIASIRTKASMNVQEIVGTNLSFSIMQIFAYIYF